VAAAGELARGKWFCIELTSGSAALLKQTEIGESAVDALARRMQALQDEKEWPQELSGAQRNID